MNPRIQELAYQAEDYADFMVDGGSEFHPVFVKKFAELIVRECASKVDWILAEGGRTQGDILKRHFGVE